MCIRDRNYQCEIRFKEPVNFNRKSYPIAYSLKEAVREEINRLLKEDIIEPTHSPYTSPILAVPKKNGKVRIWLDAREINKTIINDRTSPGEIEEIDVYKRQMYGNGGRTSSERLPDTQMTVSFMSSQVYDEEVDPERFGEMNSKRSLEME